MYPRLGTPALYLLRNQADQFVLFNAVVLNRGYTYHLGVRGAKAGGTKHQSLQGLAH